jgi:MFS family permease
MSRGRKPILLAFSFLGIVGCGLSIVKQMAVLCIGRFVYGFSAGMLVVAAPKVIAETVPLHVSDYGYGVSTNFVVNVMVFLSMIFGIGMPTSDEELATTSYWQLVYLFPVLLFVLSIFSNLVLHKEDAL